MDISTFVMILGGLFLLSVLLIGGGIALMRSQRKSDAERIAEEKKGLMAEGARSVGSGEGGKRKPEKDSTGRVEILRALRDPVDGRIEVALAGKTVEDFASMSPEQRDILQRVLEELSGWVDRVEEKSAAPVELPERDDEPAPQEQVPFAATLPEEPTLAERLPFRKKPVVKPAEEEPPAPPRSIAEQIDEILREKVAQSGMERAVRLSEEPGGGLKIIVGARQYQSIDEVAEEDVKALIKSAVREWNEKNRLNPNHPRP